MSINNTEQLMRGMYMLEENNCCVCCGAIIPEGLQCCRQCYEDIEQMVAIKEYIAKKNKRKQRILGTLEKFKIKIPLLGG